MQLLSVIDTATGVKVAHRAFPAAVQVLLFSAFLLFMAFTLAKADMSNANWLPPFDRLPTLAQHALLLVFIGAALGLVLWPIIRGIKVLVWGEIWGFDSVRRLVTRNGKAVVSFSEIKTLRIKGDSRSRRAPAARSRSPRVICMRPSSRGFSTSRGACAPGHRSLTRRSAFPRTSRDGVIPAGGKPIRSARRIVACTAASIT
jgi:hypothetical protein